ncbi:hypothetical protein PJ267_20785 [Arthrobacter sp. OVS8]|nr:hypothetical protein PJ267_20785 [Arthrobacter sp. OVS8]
MIRSPWNRRIAAVASLGDEGRRKLFDFVASAGNAVSRDDAAAALGLPRSTASFQLDRLVQDGLLAVEFRKLGGRGGPGSGRPAKLYLAAVREVAASVPDRNYDLAAELLVAAIEESAADGGSAREALVRTAYARGWRQPGPEPARRNRMMRGRQWRAPTSPGSSRRRATVRRTTARAAWCCSTVPSTGSPRATPRWSAP